MEGYQPTGELWATQWPHLSRGCVYLELLGLISQYTDSPNSGNSKFRPCQRGWGRAETPRFPYRRGSRIGAQKFVLKLVFIKRGFSQSYIVTQKINKSSKVASEDFSTVFI